MKYFTILTSILVIGTNSWANFIETFDSATSMTNTHFSTTYLGGTGQFVPHTMSGVVNAPTSDQLPVSVGGDKELRYAGTGSGWAIAPETSNYQDSFISGYAGTALTSTYGTRYANLLTRANPNTRGLDAYVSSVSFGSFGHNTVSFHLQLMKNGLRHADYISASSYRHSINFTTENIYFEMTSIGDQISSSYWKVDSAGNKSFMTSLSFEDSTFSLGANGIGARAAQVGQAIYIDDINVEQIPEPLTISFLFSALTLFILRRNICSNSKYGSRRLYIHLNKLFSQFYLRTAAQPDLQDRWKKTNFQR